MNFQVFFSVVGLGFLNQSLDGSKMSQSREGKKLNIQLEPRCPERASFFLISKSGQGLAILGTNGTQKRELKRNPKN